MMATNKFRAQSHELTSHRGRGRLSPVRNVQEALTVGKPVETAYTYCVQSILSSKMLHTKAMNNAQQKSYGIY
jgi:hypothetical protein